MSSIETMKTWSFKVRCPEEIPESLKEEFTKVIAYETEFPYTVFTPGHRILENRINTQLIAVTKDHIHILEIVEGRINTKTYLLSKINLVERSTVILNSSILINGIIDDELHSSEIMFNTACQEVFVPIVKAIRMTDKKLNASGSNGNLEEFDYLRTVNYKLMNCSIDSIIPGQRVVFNVYQPEININQNRFLKKRLCSSSVIILTEDELIIIKESDESRKKKFDDYGYIMIFIPMNKIANMFFEENYENKLIDCTIKLAGDNTLNFIFGLENKDNACTLIEKFKSAASEINEKQASKVEFLS